MGGRSSTGNRNSMNVPYDEWGDMVSVELVRDKNGTVIGFIKDTYYSEKEPVHREVSKKDVLNYIEEWRNDDGTYGTGDEAIYVAYKDGSFVNVTELEPGEKWSKRNIVGLSISTADDEMVWGGEYLRSGEFSPYTTHEFDSNGNPVDGYENSYSGYRTSAMWKVRIRETSYRDENGRTRTKREVIRQSTKKRM